jgi:hypothetical protein
MNRSFAGSGVYVASVESIWFAGACERPFLVTNANWKVSMTFSQRLSRDHLVLE